MTEQQFEIEQQEFVTKKETKTQVQYQKPANAFIAVSWFSLLTGVTAFLIGLWNAEMFLNEKGYYFAILLYGLFSVISVQKSVRDKLEGIPVTELYYGLSWFSTLTAILLLVIGLWNTDLLLSEKGFYGMSFVLSLFSAIAVQKNTRDTKSFHYEEQAK